MHQLISRHALPWIAFILSLLVMGVVLWGPSLARGQVSSRQRWNPRRVPAGTEFIGDQACGECHQKMFVSHAEGGMAMAMESVADSRVLNEHPKLSMRVGPYTYEIKRNGKQSTYSVTDGNETVSLPILYVFGQGKAGQTYVLQRDGKFFESLVSFYNEPKGLDFTIGAPRVVPKSLPDAVGRLLSDQEVSNCFGCHSTDSIMGGQLRLDKLTPGVHCEGCHGPGTEHVAALKAGRPGSKFIFNPGRLSGDELTQQFCASCHRGSDEFSLLKSMEINNVRFQPYRIFHSKCYSDDRNISCIACHNPHEPIKEDVAYYDAKCLRCHALKDKPAPQGSSPSCPVANNNCASCHMPKIDVPAAHFKFTDHYIRIVKSGENFPTD